MKRTDCLAVLAESVTDELVVVAVGGLIDEWHHLRPRDLNYYSGGMGLASSIGLGLSLARPDRKVIVLDGDGALLMNLGSLASAGQQKPPNLLHLVFNNGTYESSGGFSLPGSERTQFHAFAKIAGVGDTREVNGLQEWRDMLPGLLRTQGHVLVDLKVVPGDSVPLMTEDKLERRYRFQRALEQGSD
jgi:thiamine pyrophosphate-dependent acetolactate synthase large subunit-like protein